MSVRTQYYQLRLKGKAKTTKKPPKTELVAVVKDLLFTFAQATLLPAATAELTRIVAKLKQYPGVRFTVDGHASVEGSDLYNQDLSERRAKAVRTWLTTTGGLDAGRFDVKGYGEKKPLRPSNNADGSPNYANRQKNRRVEIRQIKPSDDGSDRQETGKEYDVDVTPYVDGEIVLDDEDGLIQMLMFKLVDSALWTNALTIGMGVSLEAGPSEADKKQEFFGNVKRIEPTLSETGEIQLSVTAYGKEWFQTAREPRDLIYPSDNSSKTWARAQALTVSTIVKHLAQDAGLKVGEIKITRDVTYTRQNPLRQHHQTDWAFLQELMLRVKATAYLKMDGGENKLYVQDNAALVKNVSNYTLYWPLREGGEFKLPSAGENQLQILEGSITLDPDKSDTGVGSIKTKVDPATGEDKIVKEEYNKDTKEWEDWVLDEAALRRLPEAQRDAMIDAYLGGNLTWEDVKPYFRRAEVSSESSRIPEDNFEEVLVPTGNPTAQGIGATAYAAQQKGQSLDAENWQLDPEKLRQATPQERSRVLDLAARQVLGYGNAAQLDALQYFRYVPKNTEPVKAKPPQKEKPVPEPPGKGKKKRQPKIAKRDAGFKIECELYGHPEMRTRTSYVIQGLLMYSGTYYLFRLKKRWGPNGFMVSPTFVR